MAIPEQAPDSSVRGYVQGEPIGQRPGQITPGQTLENLMQQLVAGVAHMEETLVRPRYQPQPPNLPDKSYTWCAVGITQMTSLGYAGIVHHPGVSRWLPAPDVFAGFFPPSPKVGQRHRLRNGLWYVWNGEVWLFRGPPEPREGYDQMQRHEEFQVLCSFYGPDADWYSQNLHDGFEIWQNRSLLRYYGIAFVDAGDRNRNPELIKQEWIDRYDKTLTFRRIIVRDYPILNLLRAPFTIRTSPGDYSVSLEA